MYRVAWNFVVAAWAFARHNLNSGPLAELYDFFPKDVSIRVSTVGMVLVTGVVGSSLGFWALMEVKLFNSQGLGPRLRSPAGFVPRAELECVP